MKAIIFNLEGTLLDVREALCIQYETLTEEFDGVKAPREAIIAAAHGTPDQMTRALVSNTTVPFEAVRKRHHELGQEVFAQYAKLYDGVADLLLIVKRLGLKTAVLTHGDVRMAALLDQTGISQHFQSIVTAETLPRLKPHADSVHYVLQQLAVLPGETLVVGDGVSDILAGKNAGVAKTIGVSHGFGSIEALRAAGADHVVHDIPAVLDYIG